MDEIKNVSIPTPPDIYIIRGLEYCASKYAGKEYDCDYCMIKRFCHDCNFNLPNAILDIINRKNEEIEALIAGQETLQKHLAEKNAEVEDLTRERDFYKAPSSELARGIERTCKRD